MPPPMRQVVDQLFTRHEVTRPLAAVEGSSFEHMRQLIGVSDLLGVLPRSAALKGRAGGELVILKPQVGDDFAPISLICRSDVEPPRRKSSGLRTKSAPWRRR